MVITHDIICMQFETRKNYRSKGGVSTLPFFFSGQQSDDGKMSSYRSVSIEPFLTAFRTALWAIAFSWPVLPGKEGAPGVF